MKFELVKIQFIITLFLTSSHTVPKTHPLLFVNIFCGCYILPSVSCSIFDKILLFPNLRRLNAIFGNNHDTELCSNITMGLLFQRVYRAQSTCTKEVIPQCSFVFLSELFTSLLPTMLTHKSLKYISVVVTVNICSLGYVFMVVETARMS